MTLKNIFSKSFKQSEKSKKEDEANCVLLKQIASSMEELCSKAQMMNDSCKEQKDNIQSIKAELNELTGLSNITAAKMEQDILGKITAVSSSCDTVLSGGTNEDLKKQLSSLMSSVNQRKALTN